MELDKLIFLDESGETCFSNESRQTHFIVTCLSIDAQDQQKIKNTLVRKYAKLFKLGWPRKKEIKATALHRLSFDKDLIKEVGFSFDGDSFIEEILETLVGFCNLSIFYIAINKKKIESEALKSAPYGIAYNYFAKIALMMIIRESGKYRLIVDQRNKETHRYQTFNEYIKTVVLDYALENNKDIVFSVEQLQSHRVYGLQAVDYFCWALNRQVCSGESRFYAHFDRCIADCKRWYC